MLVWVAGAVWFSMRALTARLLCWNLGWRRRVDLQDFVASSIKVLAAKLGIRRPIRLVESPRLRSPMAFGWWRPSIGLPSGFSTQFSTRQQEAMFSHELAHLAGRDPVWYCTADLFAALLWWHPLVWLARRRLKEASERVADEASVLVENGPQALAECLVKLGWQLTAGSRVGAPGFGGFRSNLAQRVEHLCRMPAGSWQAPEFIQSALARTAAPLILVATIVVGTGWTHPQPIDQGDSMKTIHHFWAQSMSALALLAATEPGAATSTPLPAKEEPLAALTAQPKAGTPAGLPPSTVLKDATLLYDLGKFDEAEKRFLEALKTDPGNGKAVEHYLALIREKQFAQATTVPNGAGAENPSQPTAGQGGRSSGINPALAERYGLRPKGTGAAAGMTSEPGRRSTESVRSIQSRLDQIVFDEVRFESTPLAEVLKFLSEESRKRGNSAGVNFLINPNSLPDANPTITIDPTTGQPVSQTQSEPTDMSGVIVNFNLPLRQVRLTDVLNAIVKVADKPIQFSVEEYGVVFSPASGRSQLVGTGLSSTRPTGVLAVRTFRVDTNTFLSGLESAFGITLPDSSATDRAARSRDLQTALRSLMQRLGVKMDDPTKAVFYNDLTGVLMVRATPDDLELVDAAVETLGGTTAAKPASETGAYGTAATLPGPYLMDKELMRRYGLLPANNANSNNLK